MSRTSRTVTTALVATMLLASAVVAAAPGSAAVTLTRAGLQARLITALATSEKAAVDVGSTSVFTLSDVDGTRSYTGRTYGGLWSQTIGRVTTIGTGTRSWSTIDLQALSAGYGADTVTTSLALLKKPAARWLTYRGTQYGTLHQYGTAAVLKQVVRQATSWKISVRRGTTTYTVRLPDQVDTFVVDARGRIVREVFRSGFGTSTAVFSYARPRAITVPAALGVLDGNTFFAVVSARDQQRTAARNVATAADSFATTRGHPATTVADILEALDQPRSDAATYAASPTGAVIGSTLRPGLPPLCVTTSATLAVVVPCA